MAATHWDVNWQQKWFVVALLFYAMTRVLGLADYPLEFSPDEANLAVQAGFWVDHKGYDMSGTFLPVYFQNFNQYNTGVGVYLQAIPYLLNGRAYSMAGTRLVTALLSVLGVYWFSKILQERLKLHLWWLGPLLFSALPGWFFLSRMGYETAQMATFFVGMVYFYGRYRFQHPVYLFPALVLGGLAFYTYVAASFMLVLLGGFILVSDARYHLQQRRWVMGGIVLVVLLALPQVRFLLEHPGEYQTRLILYGAVWTSAQSIWKQLAEFFNNYWIGLSPAYWFLPNTQRFPDYRVLEYAYLPWAFLPFFLWGGWQMVRRWREPFARAMIAWLLVTPVSAASVGVQLVRVLVFVFPAMVWTMVGMEDALQWLGRKWPRPWRVLELSCALLLMAGGGGIVVNTLIPLPVWEWDAQDYGARYRMEQIFAEAVQYRREHPGIAVSVTPNMIWNTPILQFFYAGQDPMMDTQPIDRVLRDYVPDLAERRVYLVSAREYEQSVLTSNKVEVSSIERVVRNRRDEPMAFLIQVRYLPGAEQIFAQELVDRHALLESSIQLDGSAVAVRHSRALEDSLLNAMDGNLNSAFQTNGVNPLILELTFEEPQRLKGVQLRLGAEPLRVQVRVQDGAAERTWQVETVRTGDFQDVVVDFEAEFSVATLWIEVLNPYGLQDEIVHLWEVAFLRP